MFLFVYANREEFELKLNFLLLKWSLSYCCRVIKNNRDVLRGGISHARRTECAKIQISQ